MNTFINKSAQPAEYDFSSAPPLDVGLLQHPFFQKGGFERTDSFNRGSEERETLGDRRESQAEDSKSPPPGGCYCVETLGVEMGEEQSQEESDSMQIEQYFP